MAYPAKDVTGERFGDLVAVERGSSRGKGSRWWCVCDCGERTLVALRNLQAGGTVSCGCAHRTKLSRHGLSRNHALYSTWCEMRARCNNDTHRVYKHYGGRGIYVCERWQSFQNLVEDMDPRPSAEYSMDRIDNDGPYAPENCRWATQSEQNRNQRPRGCSATALRRSLDRMDPDILLVLSEYGYIKEVI